MNNKVTTDKIDKKNLKTLDGVVVSDKMQKTVVVSVERYVKHPKYHKFIIKSKRYSVHDEDGSAKVGDKVSIQSCRPMSKQKFFMLKEINGVKV